MKKSMSLIGILESSTSNFQKTLNEDLIASAAREGKLVASELEGYLKMMMKDAKMADELTKAGIRTSEELLSALKGNRLTKSMKGALELSVLKSNTKNAKLIDLASENLVRNKMFDQKYAAEFAKGQPAYEKALKQAGYSEDAITKIVQKKFNQIDPKTGKPYARPETINAKGTSATNTPKPSGTPPKEVKGFLEKYGDKLREQLKKKPNWKTMVAWGAGLGISAAALWWMLSSMTDKPSDTPQTPPTDTGNWAPCIKDLLDKKEAVIGVSPKGEVSVIVKDSTYPEGVQFYTNGRVFNIKTKEMGSWTCKEGKTTLEEQAGTIDDNTMDSYVDSAVDDLDGYVAEYNLESLYNILNNLKGKTHNGKDAIQSFLSYYQQDENVDFVTDMQSVGVKNLSVRAKNLKTQIIDLAQGKGATTTPTPTTTGSGTSGINIVWDAKKGEVKTGGDGAKKVGSGKKSSFKDCNGKPLPHEFGCRSEQIKKLQACLGIEPQLGNFGPKTKKALEDITIDVSGGITQTIIDTVCGGERKREKIEPIKIPTRKIDTSLKTPDIKLTAPKITSIYEAGKKLYDDLTSSGTLYKELGRFKYKGDYLSQTDLDELNRYLDALGWKFMKEKDKEDYDVKYVWVKK